MITQITINAQTAALHFQLEVLNETFEAGNIPQAKKELSSLKTLARTVEQPVYDQFRPLLDRAKARVRPFQKRHFFEDKILKAVGKEIQLAGANAINELQKKELKSASKTKSPIEQKYEAMDLFLKANSTGNIQVATQAIESYKQACSDASEPADQVERMHKMLQETKDFYTLVDTPARVGEEVK